MKSELPDNSRHVRTLAMAQIVPGFGDGDYKGSNTAALETKMLCSGCMAAHGRDVRAPRCEVRVP